MITFFISILLLIVGYMLYGKFVEKVFGIGSNPTPAIQKADGVDFIALPNWKVFMIQFLNIAGTGPIFGAIMGAKFGPSAYLWIVFGCIFAGAVHDYLVGMLSVRNGGASLPQLVGQNLGNVAKKLTMVFTVLLLLAVGVVFVSSPALILTQMWGNNWIWLAVIFGYYILATVLPVDTVIARFYPIFALCLLFQGVALLGVLCVKMPVLPEVWDGLQTRLSGADSSILPCLFITIACGALSGFHATQTPLMARCVKSEAVCRPAFYGAMVAEGLVALIWATVAMYFFYAEPTPGHAIYPAANGIATSAPVVVNAICNDWLGLVGGILAMISVVVCPITSGDTAFRSARLIIAESLGIEQKKTVSRLMVCIPMFVAAIGVLAWQLSSPDGFDVLWKYFGFANQTLAVIALWTVTVYLCRKKKLYVITLLPAIFMTYVCTMFICISQKVGLGMDEFCGSLIAAAAAAGCTVWFFMSKKNLQNGNKE